MAAMAPSRTRGGVGRSQMPWPRLMPWTRSHSRVMRRMSDWARSWRRRAMRMRRRTLLRRERIPQHGSARQVAERFHQDVQAARQVAQLDLLVHVVARIRLAREPHAEGDG